VVLLLTEPDTRGGWYVVLLSTEPDIRWMV
jgi:hypothetical protein